jgi:hypothetical protein
MQVLWIVGVVVAVSAGLFIINRFFIHRPLWDWLKLLIVPAVLTAGGVWFNRQQRKREMEIAEQRAQDEALQAYLDKMTELLVVHGLGKPQGDPVGTVAWARTKTVLRRLDGDRKGAVLRFLNEAELIRSGRPVIRTLSGAHLVGANLERSYLQDVALNGVDLSGAVLREADLSGADLRDADLKDADLSGAKGVTNEKLYEQATCLKGATMPNGQKYEEWLKSKDRRENRENSGTS